MKRRVYLSFEVAKRELLARLFTAIELSDSFEVLIGDKSSFNQYIQYLRPGDFFLKSIGPKNIILPIILDTNKKNLIKRKKIKLFNYNNKFVSQLFDDICKLKKIDNLNIKEYYPGIYIIRHKK